MITLDDIRGYAMALPEVEEGTHFRMPAFRVRGKGFVGLEKGTHAQVAVDRATAEAAVASDPDTYEEMWRQGRYFVGVRVDLAKVSGERLRELIEHAWRNKAPKRLAAAFDERSGETS